MGSSLSRVSPYLTAQTAFLVFGGYVAFVLLRRYLAAASARRRLAGLQQVKRDQKARDFALVMERLPETADERKEKEEEIAHASAVTLVQKMNNSPHAGEPTADGGRRELAVAARTHID